MLSQVKSSHKSIKFSEFLSMLLNDLCDARMLYFLNRISWISVFLTHSRKINGVISFPNLIIMLMCLMACKCVKYQIMMVNAIRFGESNHLNVQSTKFITTEHVFLLSCHWTVVERSAINQLFAEASFII